LVVLGHRNHQIGIFRPGSPQHRRHRGVTGHRAQIKTILQLCQTLAIAVDDGDVVLFRNQPLCQAGSHLPGTENDDLHARPL
jgi:hypothetical protein